ncbi:hypothetical protein [Parenemella sanctibonifatiensis]|nr:hypothetical protein [Parenemella sanctibonifatiensis]
MPPFSRHKPYAVIMAGATAAVAIGGFAGTQLGQAIGPGIVGGVIGLVAGLVVGGLIGRWTLWDTGVEV